MAGTAKDYNVSEIICGPGNLWAIGVAPTNAAVQLTLAANGTPDATAHPGSVHLGAVESSIVTAIKPKIAPINTDQYEAPIDSYVTELDGSIEATLQQVESSQLQRALGVGTYSAISYLSTGTGPQLAGPTGTNGEQMTFGGTYTVPKICLAVISPTRQNPNQYVVSVLYIGVSMSGFALALGRAKAASYKAKFQGLSDPTRTAGQQIGVLYQTLVNASGGTPQPMNFQPAQIFQGPTDLWLVSPAPTDAIQQVTIDPTTLTPSSTVHANSAHLGILEGPATFSVTPKIELIKGDQFDGALDAYLSSLTVKIEATCLSSTMANLAQALGVGNYTLSVGNFAQCTFGGTNQPPTICIAAIAGKRTTPAKAICGCLFRVNAADGITWTAQRNKPSTFRVGFTGQADVTRTAGRTIGIYQEWM
jgi:hypothetical protein